MQKVEQKLMMVGANGFAVDSTGARNLKNPHLNWKPKYLNFQNLSSNVLRIYAPSQNPLTDSPLYAIGEYMQISVMITSDLHEGLQLYFINSSGDNTTTKQATLIWSDESLNWSHSLAPSYSAGGATPNSVNVVNQPTVNIGNTPNVNVSNTVNVAGDFDGTASIAVSAQSAANSAVSVTAPAVSGKKVRLTYVSAVNVGAAIVNDAVITITDGATVVYRAAFGTGQVRGNMIFIPFNIPIESAAQNQAITVTCAAAGASVVILLNAGYYYK